MQWWYLIYLALFVGISIGVVVVRLVRDSSWRLQAHPPSAQHWDTQTPAWAVVVALVLGLIYVLPGGFIFAMTSQEVCSSCLPGCCTLC